MSFSSLQGSVAQLTSKHKQEPPYHKIAITMNAIEFFGAFSLGFLSCVVAFVILFIRFRDALWPLMLSLLSPAGRSEALETDDGVDRLVERRGRPPAKLYFSDKGTHAHKQEVCRRTQCDTVWELSRGVTPELWPKLKKALAPCDHCKPW